jgi:hypothetical protein
MTPMWTGRTALVFLGLTAASGAAFVTGFSRERHPPVKTGDAIAAAAAIAAPTVGVGDEHSLVMAPAIGVRSLGSSDEVIPAFDVALVGPAGDAVIAGTAAPGASVELLRNGQILDQAVANQLGQFAMDPPRLPSGRYELTLRSREPNGKQSTSRKGVAIAVH